MDRPEPSSDEGSEPPALRLIVFTVANVVLVLAVLGGYAAWRVTGGVAPGQVIAAFSRRSPARAPSPIPTASAAQPASAAGQQTAMTYYLVSSEQQAAGERQELDRLNRIRVEQGEPPLDAAVVVVGSPQADAEFLLAIGLERGGRWAGGPWPIEVVDLRPAGAPP